MNQEYAADYLIEDSHITPQDWLDAYQVQDACNLAGVVNSWARIQHRIIQQSMAQFRGTDWANRHPINVMFADKVAQLTGTQGVDDLIWDAYGVQGIKTGRA